MCIRDRFGVTVLLFCLGLRWGPVGIATAWSASFWILFIPAFWYAGRPIRFGVTPVLASVWRYVLASMVAGCATAAIIYEIRVLTAAPGILGAIARILATSVLFLVLYLGAIIALHGGPAPLYRFGALIPEMLPWVKSRGSLSQQQAAPLGSQSADVEPVAMSERFIP